MRPQGILFDLLMAVMNSLDVWQAAAGDRARGLEWRDRVTARMTALGRYRPYEELVDEAAGEVGLGPDASRRLVEGWAGIDPWPDAKAIAGVSVPYGFVTNCSTQLARIAAARSGMRPRFTLSAEEAGWYKPAAPIYREACHRLGTAPERTAFVAGSPYDAAGARAAGLQAWLVRRRDDHGSPLPAIRDAPSLADVLAAIARPYSER
jgi:2-haloacid dehalogenase